MAKDTRFVEKKIANLVTRRDYSKQQVDFEEPDLLAIQRESYKEFLEDEEKGVKGLIASYFPIRHTKNNTHEVIFLGAKLEKEGAYTETEARYEGKTFERPLYVDLGLKNNETGEVKRVLKRKPKKNDDSKKVELESHDGIFFANIPMMTSNGTFIINGIEKFVISQTVRSPGAYVLSKSQIKLGGKKKVVEGYVCEMFPNKGTMMNFWIDDRKMDNPILKVVARNSSGENAVTFSATQLLKAFGLKQNVIQEIFGGSEVITKTLAADKTPKSFGSKFEGCYHHDVIGDNPVINAIRKDVDKEYTKLLNANNGSKPSKADMKTTGLPIDRKIRELVWDWNELEKEKASIEAQLVANPTDKAIKAKQIELIKKIREAKEDIITEKAAMDIINLLGLSKRPTEQLSVEFKDFSYQDYLIRHFMTKKSFDIASAGRSKLNQKLRVTERLYQKVLANDILTKQGKVFMKKGTLITKNEINEIKQAISGGHLDIAKKYDIFGDKASSFVKAKKNKIEREMVLETIDIFPDNHIWDEGSINIIGISPTSNAETLLLSDIIAMISYAINLPHNIGNYDDIDHLGNKRLRLISEQFLNKLNAGMGRVQKHILEKLASLSTPTMNEEQKAKKSKAGIKGIVNTKPFQQVVKAFFNSYQLTQFIDQQNPLSELTNKRRISAMGDGGIRREDPNLNIRDVHYSHYGRICPIETPEGMNIGLIMSLASFAKVDKNGFIVSPYYIVEDGVITNKIRWLNAAQEDEYVIGESSIPHEDDGRITTKAKVVGRYRGMQELYNAKEINYIDVNPRQVVSIAASTIPFLENDDTARALMGSNMQRQALPLLRPYAPLVGTGAEYKIAHDSGLNILAKEDGEVTAVDGNHIVVKNKNGENDKYDLVKYRKTNQSTCNNQLPIVEIGQKVKQGQVIADGPAMFNGELAIGRNPIIAYTTWHGYNFEDAIVISKRLVQDDWYTSISIEEYECKCSRITKLNADEEITRDLPNVSEDVKTYLDEDGIIMIGAEVKEGDILVGRISPKGATDYSPEEKLLNAIFGNKSHGYKDSSLKVPHGGEGTVIGIKRFTSKDGYLFDDETIEVIKVYIAQKRKLQIGDKMSGRHGNKGTISKIVPVEDMPHLPDGTPVDILLSPLGVPSRMNIGQILEVHLGWAMRNIAKKKLFELVDSKARASEYCQLFGMSSIRAQLLKDECLDYFKKNKINTFKDFSDIDLTIILNKVGMSQEDLSYKASTPVFCGAKLDDISAALAEVGIDASKTRAKTKLIDGQTGEYFDGEITVGVMYMLKLDHMVDDKVHARAIGPYSKVNQQPLGGRSQNGGQRFGEMEVWALEAYGATHNLREILTVKSDDEDGRNRTYNAIIKGLHLPKTSLPASFKLLTKQLQGLCMSMTVYDQQGNKHDMNEYSKSTLSDEDIQEAKRATQVEEVETSETSEYQGL